MFEYQYYAESSFSFSPQPESTASIPDINKVKDFVRSFWNEWVSSESRQYMDTVDRYYNNESDITMAQRFFIERNPETDQPTLRENNVLANNKLSHPFFRKLIKQKVSYMLGKPFTLSASQAEDEQAKVFFSILNKKYFSKSFYRGLKNVCEDSIAYGRAWVQMYYTDSGTLSTRRVRTQDICPIWGDLDHTLLLGLIYQYKITVYDGDNKKTRVNTEYYTVNAGVYYFYQDTDKSIFTVDTSVYPDGHGPNFFVDVKDADGQLLKRMGGVWSRIPFICFKYDSKEASLLPRIKPLIDEYDSRTSQVANDIQDFPNSITVVKNYDGADKAEFIKNKSQFRTVFISNDGDAHTLNTPLNIADIELHLKRIQDDIYEAAQGVNTAKKDIRDTSGVALRFLYADLDMDCADWSVELSASLENLIWFIIQDLKQSGQGDYSDVEYDIIFNNDVIINETETIQNCFTSSGLISDLTIAENHPWTKSAEKEIQGLTSDMKTELSLEQQYGSTFSAPADGQRSAKE